MVHEKYIKRGDKIFGPYLYKNYRENGVTKTKYLGRGGARKKKKLQVNKILFIILGIIVLILIFGLFALSEKRVSGVKSYLKEGLGSLELKGKLFSEKFFNVFVGIFENSPPKILDLSGEILVCENKVLAHFFNVTDGDGLNDLKSVIISPVNPFFVSPGRRINDSFAEYQIWSRPLVKFYFHGHRNPGEGWATYREDVLAEDKSKARDLFTTNIVIIEVNNPPDFDIGVQTIWTKGDNNTFYYDLGKELRISLEETPTDELIFNLTYPNGSISPFNISDRGIINITGNETFIDAGNISKVYGLMVCVNDTGLQTSIHPDISLCLGDYPPQDEDPKKYCDNFTLTITKKNRGPAIVSYFPQNLSFSAGAEILYFNVTARDSDLTPVDVYWYVDGVEKDYFEGLDENGVSEFEYGFGCGVSGNHVVGAVVTDGLLNDSVYWNVSVQYVSCFAPSSGGGGGSGGLYCREKWGCEEWGECENFEKVSELRMIVRDRLLIEERCGFFNYTEDICGFQERLCFDANYCNTKDDKPGTIRECYYTENPNCADGIRNCHDGGCEVLIDCGGPCELCPTCSDGIQNQGEERVDCGGPCEPCKEFPLAPRLFKSIVSYSLIALLILVSLLVAMQILRYHKFKGVFRRAGIGDKIRGFGEKSVVASLFFIFIVLLLFFANIYIMDFAQRGKTPSGIEDIGFIASYGLINNFMRNFGIFFISVPFISVDGTTQIILGDDSDGASRRAGQDFNFYADYTYTSGGGSVSSGYCRIRFEETEGYSGWNNMTYNWGSGYFEYSTIFNYKGAYNFDVECSEDSSFAPGSNGFVSGSEGFVIKNTHPSFHTYGVDVYIEEDDFFEYNFTANVTEPDLNDNLEFSIVSISLNENLSDYPWFLPINSSLGLFWVNATTDDETGGFDISVSVLDDEDVGQVVDFYFNLLLVNDAPVFTNLENKTLVSGDLFEYLIEVEDEENDAPFVFNIELLGCSMGGGCVLFTQSDYSVDNAQGLIDMSFTPTDQNIGWYEINFSVEDTNVLGNAMTSRVVKFVVETPIWKKPLNLNYSLVEDKLHLDFPLNLSEKVIYDGVVFSFEKYDVFPSFDIVNGIINFTPKDADVGYHEVKITADYRGANSSKIFNFTVENINDNVSIVRPLTADNILSIDGNSNIDAYENANITIYLFADDDDFLIPQKSFYDESLTLNLSVEGPNVSLFGFVFDSVSGNRAIYTANFIPRKLSVGSYNLTVNITDKNNFSDVLYFNLTIVDRDYDAPVINFPDEGYEFNLKENITSNLTFRASHTVGDSLLYMFYINGFLRYSVIYPGDDRDLVWEFAPSFIDETYNWTGSLTLIVKNPYFSDLNASRTWNLTVNHTNAPVEFIKEIGDKIFPYTYAFQFELKEYFLDIDHGDSYYNQNVSFFVSSHANNSQVTVGGISGNWTFVLSSKMYSPFKELLNITGCDLNETSGNATNMTCVTSNNFWVEFIEPEKIEVPVPQPSSGGGGGGGGVISFKLIMPGSVSAYEGEKIEVPLFLVNKGEGSFSDLTLSSIAFKDGDITQEVETSLDKTLFKTIKPGQEENLTLTLFFDTDKIGDYEVMVNVSSKKPKYTDWGKIHINLQRINESEVRELIVFTEEFIVANPRCIEISEVMKEAEGYFETGDLVAAKMKSKEALDACKDAISQVAVPKRRKIAGVGLYLVIATLAALILGIIYYSWKRRRLQTAENLG